MKSLFFIFPFSLIFFFGCNSSGQSDLEEALSWSHGNDFAFDNWTQINKDFGWDKTSFLSLEWMPHPINDKGEEVPEEKQKDNFSPYASQLIKYEVVDKETPGELGFSYPDLQWEAQNKNISIIKPSPGYDPGKMQHLLSALQYNSAEYRGIKVFSSKRDPTGRDVDVFYKKDYEWMERYRGVAYSKDDNILILAPDSIFVKETIDAHLDKHSLLQEKGIAEMASEMNGAENVVIYRDKFLLSRALRNIAFNMDSATFVSERPALIKKAFGVTENEFARLHQPEFISVGEKKNGEAFSVIYFKNGGEAEADKDMRLFILKNGASLINRQSLKSQYFDQSAEVNGNCLVLRWKFEPCLMGMYVRIGQVDLPWLYSNE